VKRRACKSLAIECEIHGKHIDSALSEKTKSRELDVLLNERTHGRWINTPCCGDSVHLV
jgi:hypothetical protein